MSTVARQPGSSTGQVMDKALHQMDRRSVVVSGWIMCAAMTVFLVYSTLHNLVGEQELWSTTTGRLLDYRDTVVHPAHFLLRGGNPYDPATFLSAYPWSQEFDPYAPLWLLITFPLGILPLHVGGGIFIVLLYAGEAWMACTLSRWIMPRHARALAPLLYLWMMVWSPTRLVGATTLIAIALTGVCVAMRRRDERWSEAWLLAVCCIKPQFGLPLALFLLAWGRWRTVLRGGVALLLGSLIPLLLVVRNAGGLPQFVDSIRRDIAYAASPSAPTGLASAISFRTDIPGLVARLGGEPMSGPVQAGIILLVAGLAVMALVRRPPGDLAAVLVTSAMLLVPVHHDYDLAVFVIAASAAASWVRRHRDWVSWLLLVFCVLPVVHLHRITSLTGLSLPQVEALDVLCVSAALVTATILSMRKRRGESLPGPQGRLAELDEEPVT